MQDFIDGELQKAETQTVAEHIRSCGACKTELQEILALHSILNQVVSQDKCPPYDELESFVNNTCDSSKISEIKEHIDLCSRCRFYVWALGATEADLADWQAKDEMAYKEFCETDLGFSTVKNTLQKLLPSKIDLLEKAWESVLSLVLDLKYKALGNWPSFNQQTQLVGVLGFAEISDPQTDAASIIMATTLYVSQAVTDGDIKATTEDIEVAIKEVASKLGAGKQLQQRLIETVPPIILKFN
ncbi:MAG: zf-HC2 domain-containing protein [Anaerohalosphaera sp.]|nr:zf-HC2 domain-containing protein [Anaerohalosphaera sp.]